MSNAYIFLLYAPIMCVMYYLANWMWRWTKLVEKGRKKPSLPCERDLPKYKDCERTNVVITHMNWNVNDLWDNTLTSSHVFLWIRFYMFFYNPHWCFISINSVDTRYLNSLQNPFSNQWLYVLVTLYRLC